MVSSPNPASSLRCVFCKSSAVPLEKHLLIKIIKADSSLFFFHLVQLQSAGQTKVKLFKRKLFQIFSCKPKPFNELIWWTDRNVTDFRKNNFMLLASLSLV